MHPPPLRRRTDQEAGSTAQLRALVVDDHEPYREYVASLVWSMATRDELTGLFNRRLFFFDADRFLAEGRTINLIFFDLDNFKSINDTLGHLAGDRILRDIGALFLRRTRSEDLIARYGGDEFVMLVPDLPPGEVEALARRVGEEVTALQWIFGTDIFSVGVTTGISCSSLLDKPSIGQLIGAGDRDLYKNKWLRKNPDEDPAMYEYDSSRHAHVIELLTIGSNDQAKKADGNR